MSFRTVAGKRYANGRIGETRLSVPLTGCKTDDAARERGAAIALAARKLLAASRSDRFDLLTELGAATTVARATKVLQAIEIVLKEPSGAMTFGDLADRWTDGTLARNYPDHVRVKRSVDDDRERFAKYILPTLRDVPMNKLTLDHALTVLRSVGTKASPATRRHVAQLMSRLCKLAVFPCRIIDRSPLPPGFLPKLGPAKAKSSLWADEEAQLLTCAAVPIDRRLAWGILAREGLRLSELLALEWSSIDLVRGVLTLDRNKTNAPRAWPLGLDVHRALRRWRQLHPKARLVVAPDNLDMGHAAHRLRLDVEAAKLDRPQLTERSKERVRFRAHDLRASFCTLALATGRTEAWCRRRTGHTSSSQLAKYERMAETAAELGQPWFSPLDELLDLRFNDGSIDAEGTLGETG